MKKRFRRLFTGMLSAVMTLSAMPLATIHGENEVQKYPYTFFAGSSADGAITINANNVCINGNIATNGTIAASSANFNVNGTITENAAEPIVQCFAKIDNTYFDPTVVETYFEDYFREDTNINVNTPIEAEGDIELIGNINISSGLKALNDVNLSGNVENTQNSAICSETGDIIIDTENVNLSGLVYAPNGNVNISAMNLNINGVVIIADTITIDCPSLNANYSAAVGEFIGTSTESEPETEIYLITYGEYIPETESIKVYWNTNVPQGTFDIQVSDDGESYTSVGTVTDEESYEYAITETFSQKYIKVIETIDSGESYEAAPIIVKNSDDGYDIEPLDSDEDGLPDFFELKIGTAIDNADTDNDGLTDYQEFAIVGTDPVIFDSAEEGTSDADYDSDSDGLSNIDEITRNTDPRDSDTDMDGLFDYDEIFVYDTDPLVADSDNDGIDDGSEIKLGLDPNSAATHDVPDGEYKIDQVIGADNGILSSINTEESPYSLSIEMKTNGDMEKEISVINSGYSNVIENDAMLGASLDISMSDTCNPEDIVLKYDIKPEFIENTLDKYSALPEFQDIKRLNVFKFNEEEGMLLPIETKFCDNGTQLYAEVDELGTYCVMDMEIWLDNLGVEMPVKNSFNTNISYPKSAKILTQESKSKEQINLVFALQAHYDQNSKESEEEYQKKFEFQKNIIRKMSRVAFSKLRDIDLKIYIITYNDEKWDVCAANSDGNKYFTNYKDISDALDEATFTKSGRRACRDYAFYGINEYSPAYSYSNTFVYHLLNGNSFAEAHTTAENEVQYDAFYIQALPFSGNMYSQIYFSEDDFYYGYTGDDPLPNLSAEIEEMIDGISDPINITSDSNFERIKEHFLNAVQKRLGIVLTDTYEIIVPTNWKTVTLKDKITENGETNSDNDELTDWDEVNVDRLIWNDDGSFELPTFCLSDIMDYIQRFNDPNCLFLLRSATPFHYLPILSDPTESDSDNDGLADDEEYVYDTKIFYADSDGDGLSDGTEVELWFDPLEANSDGDIYNDSEELENNTNPYVYNLTPKEAVKAFKDGFILGDFAKSDNIETFLGQIASSFVPFAADLRDYFANMFVNCNTIDSLINWGGFLIDIFPGIGTGGDTAKSFAKIGKYVYKYADDAPKVAEAISKSAKYGSEVGEFVTDLSKHLPSGTLDKISDSIKSGKKLTKADYKQLQNVFEASGKSLDINQNPLINQDKIIEGIIRIASKYHEILTTKEDISNYDRFKCKECAKEIKKYLKRKKLHGTKVFVEYGNSYLCNELFSIKNAISDNGEHYAIIFNGVVYDNAFPKGANYEEWKNNFWAPSGELKITPTDF